MKKFYALLSGPSGERLSYASFFSPSLIQAAKAFREYCGGSFPEGSRIQIKAEPFPETAESSVQEPS